MRKTAVDSCELFDFMANIVGISVLHPGGYEATDKLAGMCAVNSESHVLDLACGRGTTAIYLTKKYGCRVTGIDISDQLIQDGRQLVEKAGLTDRVELRAANALDLPFENALFDTVISQAFFLLIDEKENALKEMNCVLKSGGSVGALELSWFKYPPEEIYQTIVKKMCGKLITRVVTYDEWDQFFTSAGLSQIETRQFLMKSGMAGMFRDEGLLNALRIMFKSMTRPSVRKRMMDMRHTFTQYSEYLGYGLFSYRK